MKNWQFVVLCLILVVSSISVYSVLESMDNKLDVIRAKSANLDYIGNKVDKSYDYIEDIDGILYETLWKNK